MSTENLIEKATYKKSMKADCAKWRKLLKAKQITLTDIHAAFNSKYPDTLSYEGFYKSLNQGKFSYANYIKAKGLFEEVEKTILKTETAK